MIRSRSSLACASVITNGGASDLRRCQVAADSPVAGVQGQVCGRCNSNGATRWIALRGRTYARYLRCHISLGLGAQIRTVYIPRLGREQETTDNDVVRPNGCIRCVPTHDMYPIDDTEICLRLVTREIRAVRERLRAEIERSRTIIERIRRFKTHSAGETHDTPGPE